MTRMLVVDMDFKSSLPQFTFTFGPLLYFYVLKTTRPQYKFRWKDVLHFIPVLVEWGAWVLLLIQPKPVFQQLNPSLHFLAFISVAAYLLLSRGLIQRFYKEQKFNEDSDR